MNHAKQLFQCYLRQSNFTNYSITDCLIRAAENAKVSVFVLAKELDMKFKEKK